MGIFLNNGKIVSPSDKNLLINLKFLYINLSNLF